jgi:lysophospholipase L1-like esterase
MRHVRHLLAVLLTAWGTACGSGSATCGTAGPVSSAGTTAGPSGPVVYVAGDSIVASGILSNPDRDGFAARLRVRLCGDRCGQPGQPTVISVAVGGTRLTDPEGKDPNALIHTWQTILDATPRPTVIVVGIGINDVALTSDAQFGDAYTRIVVSARERGIHVIPATMSPCNATLKHCGTLQPQRQAFNSWLRAYWGAENVADFSTAVRAPGTETLDPAYDSGDGLHLNAAGTRRIADSVPLDKIPPAATPPPTATPRC